MGNKPETMNERSRGEKEVQGKVIFCKGFQLWRLPMRSSKISCTEMWKGAVSLLDPAALAVAYAVGQNLCTFVDDEGLQWILPEG